MTALADIIEEARAGLSPGVGLALCRDASHDPDVCKCNCPGPGQFGSLCFVLDPDDMRTSAEIATEIES